MPDHTHKAAKALAALIGELNDIIPEHEWTKQEVARITKLMVRATAKLAKEQWEDGAAYVSHWAVSNGVNAPGVNVIVSDNKMLMDLQFAATVMVGDQMLTATQTVHYQQLANAADLDNLLIHVSKDLGHKLGYKLTEKIFLGVKNAMKQKTGQEPEPTWGGHPPTHPIFGSGPDDYAIPSPGKMKLSTVPFAPPPTHPNCKSVKLASAPFDLSNLEAIVNKNFTAEIIGTPLGSSWTASLKKFKEGG